MGFGGALSPRESVWNAPISLAGECVAVPSLSVKLIPLARVLQMRACSGLGALRDRLRMMLVLLQHVCAQSLSHPDFFVYGECPCIVLAWVSRHMPGGLTPLLVSSWAGSSTFLRFRSVRQLASHRCVHIVSRCVVGPSKN